MPKIQAQAFKQLLLNKRRGMTKAQRSKPIKMIAPPYPMAIERQYAKELYSLAFAPMFETLKQLLTKENYERWVADYNRHDSFHADAYSDEINRIIGTLKTKIEKKISNNDPLKTSLQKTVVGTYTYSKGKWQDQTKKILGTPFSTEEAWWEKTRKAWLDENITLITSQPEEYIKKISDTIYRGTRNGWTWGDISAELQKIADMTESKANLIARDQVGKLNGQLSKYRQTEIGLSYYVWTALGDERVCDICGDEGMNGGLCRWDDATVVSWDEGKTWVSRPADAQGIIPGEAHPQCRCQALAWFNDVLSETNTELGDEGDSMNTDSLSPKQKLDALFRKHRHTDNYPETTTEQKAQKLKRTPSVDDTEWSDTIMSQAFDFMNETIKVVTTYDVPYLAGYSKDRKTIYIDQHFPQFSMQGSQKVNNWKYITGHERTEDIIEVGVPGITYQEAHQMALTLERRALEADGFDWDQYNDFCNKWIKYSWHEQLTNIPPDLDIKPYLDENDQAVLLEMQRVQGKDNTLGSGQVLPE